MRLHAIVLILHFQLTHIFAHPPSSLELSLQAYSDLKGYECGDVFFTDDEIKKTLKVAKASIGAGYLFPQSYRSRLHVESEYEEYFQYPIKKERPFQPYIKNINTVFLVVFTRNRDEAVDVIARITIGDYTKCIQRGSTNIEPSHAVPGIPNGYQCGHVFFNDEVIYQNLALAQREVEGKSKHLRPYIGNLFPKNIKHLMWPIRAEDVLYRPRGDKIGPYQLILSEEKKIVDVVVKGYSKNFLRCIRSRKAPKAPASDRYSKLFVTPPKYGYVCGKIIFNENVLEQTANTIRNQATKAIETKLEIYSGPPFNQPCLIWPLSIDGKPYKTGPKGPYRLILTPKYKVMSVALYADGKYKDCEKNTILATKNHDTSSYRCRKQIFNNHMLVRAAEQACMIMNAMKRHAYPANYVGPEFEKEGPYLTFPVFQERLHNRRPGSHRVVINMNCEVVGALTTLKDGFPKRLVKCHRLDDGPLPPKFFGANAETVFEHPSARFWPAPRAPRSEV